MHDLYGNVFQDAKNKMTVGITIAKQFKTHHAIWILKNIISTITSIHIFSFSNSILHKFTWIIKQNNSFVCIYLWRMTVVLQRNRFYFKFMTVIWINTYITSLETIVDIMLRRWNTGNFNIRNTNFKKTELSHTRPLSSQPSQPCWILHRCCYHVTFVQLAFCDTASAIYVNKRELGLVKNIIKIK